MTMRSYCVSAMDSGAAMEDCIKNVMIVEAVKLCDVENDQKKRH